MELGSIVNKKKTARSYNKYLDYIRVISCVAVMFYHFNILKGGFLAVCTFFVLSGYLSCTSAFKKGNISYKDYYKKKLLHLYLPLLVVILLSVGIISLFSNINWINLKPETTSALLGYNNFWQLSANLDYFARHISSPFMHLWYISILLQFDLIFPFIYNLLRKIGRKQSKGLVCLILGVLTIGFTLYFYLSSLSENIMFVYYNTFTRIFSLLFGVLLGFIHSYYGELVPKIFRTEPVFKYVFNVYSLIQLCLFFIVTSSCKYYPIAMIFSTIISVRLIDYAMVINDDRLNKKDKYLKLFANFTYEIYLVQYPIIFIFENINIPDFIKIIIMLILNIIIALFIHLGLNMKNSKGKYKIGRVAIFVTLIIFSIFGFIKYIKSEDHSKEMKQLEDQLNKNAQMMQARQEEYKKNALEEDKAYEEMLESLDIDEETLKEIITNSKIVGVGDSVMLGAVENLYSKFSNGYFDAKISRTAWVANGILQDLKNKGLLGDPIVFGLGTNGDCNESCKEEILKTLENRKLFWVTVTNDQNVHVNSKFKSFAEKHDNVYIIDWESASKGHSEYFYADGIHLTIAGRKAYVDTIYEGIYNAYVNEIKAKKEKAIKKHDEELKNRITFYGNDLLLNAFDMIHNNYEKARFNIDKNYDFNALKVEIENAINNETLDNKLVFAFDLTAHLSKENYEEIISLCKDNEIYIISASGKLNEFTNNNVKIIDFYSELKSNPNYLMIDGIHLSNEGNVALAEMLKTYLNIES